MQNKFRGVIFTKENIKWYRRITGLQLTLGMLAFLFIFWRNQQESGTYDLITTHDFDSEIYTQGLELTDEGSLLVSSGLYGESGLGEVVQGQFLKKVALADNSFAEGLSQVGDSIWLLTWQEGKAYRYDAEGFDLEDQVSYEGEGWGLAYDESRDVLYMSDGSDQIQLRDPQSFDLLDHFQVRKPNNQSVAGLNELEYADDHLYANIYPSNQLVRIELSRFNRGRATETWDVTDLVEDLSSNHPDINELNGIAHIEEDRFYITGKNFPTLYEVRLN